MTDNKIAFFTEGGYEGKVSIKNPMRTDQAWVYALDAVHHCIYKLHNVNTAYDIGIVIIPKENNRKSLANENYPLISNIRKYCKKVIIMQEGCHWDWMEDPVNTMVWFYNQLLEADLLLAHNDADVKYYKGITDIETIILPTLMIENIPKIAEKQDRVFVAGNWHLTYRGFDAWVISNEFDLPKYGFKSGKYKADEDINGINYLPWMDWFKFMYELSKCKYAIQTYQSSAGQFPLNCAYLGIPCIGYNDINTQVKLHPELSVDRGDIIQARKIAIKLQNDTDFYTKCSEESKLMYNKLYTEEVFMENWKDIVSKL